MLIEKYLELDAFITVTGKRALVKAFVPNLHKTQCKTALEVGMKER